MGLLRGRAGRRVDSAREEAIEESLREFAAPGAHGPLYVRASPFYLETCDYLKAAAGPPAWSIRLARLHRMIDELRSDLMREQGDMRERHRGSREALSQEWRRYLAGLDLSPINELIEKHNAYYPIEAGLRMQWPSGRYILPGGTEFPMPLVSVESLLAEFPLDDPS
jgi:hypothetical protein